MIQDVKENPVLSAVDIIFQKGHKSKFSESFQKSVLREAQVVAEYLGIESLNQAITFAMLLGMGVQANSALDIDQWSNYLNVSVLRAFQFSGDLNSLAKKKLLSKQKSTRRRRGRESLNYLNFYVPSDIIESIVTNQPLPPRRALNLNHFELLSLVLELFSQLDDAYIDTDQMESEIQSILEENKKLPFARQILNFKLPIIEQIILLMVCEQFVEGYSSVDLVRLLKTLFPETQKQLTFRKEWINGKTRLQQLNLVDLESEADFRNDKAIQLTTKGQQLFGNDRSLLIEENVQQQKDIIQSSSIIEQKLFFNEREKKEIDTLTNMLIPAHYNEIVHRLKTNKLKGNFTILFSGHAGTGKTESVYQIAKVTGRDIKRVDISQTKSKWFGESEKRIKAVFDSYKKLVKNSSLTPILLFNEADGVFGTRKTLGNSTVDQTENAIQTIILQEMEDFEGIMIATTNLPTHLKEFERRLLFKISFDKPTSSTRFLIMRDKLPFLTDEQIQQLSERYKLTGGQTMNIAKKLMMNQILTGETPTMCEVLEMCESEFLVKKDERNSIGFKIGSR